MKFKFPKLSIRKWLIKKQRTELSYVPEVIHLYTDKHKNKWYGYEDLTEMGILRKLVVDEVQSYADINMTPDAMRIFVRSMRESLQVADYEHARKQLAAFELRMEFIASKAVYVNLCAAIYLMEKENMLEMDRKFLRKKQEILENDIELQDFLLRDLFRRYRDFSEDYETNIMNYFIETEQEELFTAMMLKKISDKIVQKNQKNKKKDTKDKGDEIKTA